MGSVNCKKMSPTISDENLSGCQSVSNNSEPKMDFVEGYVCKEDEINDNEMKQFDLEKHGKVLLVKQNGKISALGTKCSHYGAPLHTGALGEGRLRCPWHGACFNIETGDIEDFPGLDSIPCYQVSIEKGQVKVRARKSELESNKRVKIMALKSSVDESTYVIIGCGPSGAVCAETLRQEGFTGRIVMVGKESCLPYDRIKYSKSLDLDVNSILLRSQEFYDKHHIETMLNTEATNVNTSSNEISLSNGYKIKYDKLYVATGSTPRKPDMPGLDLKNVFVLRSQHDANSIFKNLNANSHVVVLGVSFIGLECAAYCVGKAAKVTVIGRDAVPLKPAFGEEIGTRVMQFFKEKGVNFIMNSGITEFNGNGQDLSSVTLNDGSELKADVCILGIGTILNTGFLNGSDIKMNRNGSIDTNVYLQSNVENVFVGGDIANAPIFFNDNKLATIGHYGLAQYHGKLAATNMMDRKKEIKIVPYFWTVLFGKSIRYAGHGTSHSIQIEGDLKEMKFIIFYFNKNDKVIAMASCQRDPIVSQFAEYLQQGKTLHKNQLTPDPLFWTK